MSLRYPEISVHTSGNSSEFKVPFWWLAHFCAFSCIQLSVSQTFAISHSVKQIPDGTKTGQNHRKIKSRTLQVRHPLSWTSLSSAKVRFCPVKNKQIPVNMLLLNHFYRIGIFRKIQQMPHAQTYVAYFKDLLNPFYAICTLRRFCRCTLPWTNVQPICHYQQC